LPVKLIRAGFSRRMAQHGFAGMKQMLERLQGFGWCNLVEHAPGGLLVRWAQGVGPFLRACGWREGDEAAVHAGVVRLTLFLELLAMETPPGFSAQIVNTPPGDRWAAVLLAEVGRGRYRPAWWDAPSEWHENLRRGLVPMPVFFPQVIKDGLVRTAQRLAEFGWLDFEVCDVPGYRCCMPGPWRQEISPLVTLLTMGAMQPGLPAGIDPTLAAAGRLSLLLHLKLMKAPADLLVSILAAGGETDLWVASLAHRITRGITPLWWDRKLSWHVAVLGNLADQVRRLAA